MQFWLELSVIVTCVALIIQVIALTALFFQLRRVMEKVSQLTSDLQTRVGPILTRVQLLLDDVQPKISNLVSDASHVVYLARGQAQKVDRVFTDAADRLRGQLMHLDRILTGTLETIENTGAQIRNSVWRPVQKASALITGIKVGLDFLRSRRAQSPVSDERLEQEEELFI
jgi:uncharacterized protein YoxC